MKKYKPYHQKNIWLVLLAVLLLANACTCNNKGNKEQDRAVDTSAAMGRDSTLLDTFAIARQPTPEHFDTAAQHWVLKTLNKKQFDPADFETHRHSTAEESTPKDTAEDVASLPAGPLGPTSNFDMPKDFTKQYASILRWSRDSNYIVDLGSYGRVPVQDSEGKIQLEGGEPDTRVMLINMASNQQTQILFGGPGLQVMDAKWMNDSVFALLYANTVHSEPDTLLMLTNTHTLKANTYKYKEKQ